MDFLSKLLITLREAALQTIQVSEEAASAAEGLVRQEAAGKINELEASLNQMQADLDMARLEAKEATELYEATKLAKNSSEAKAVERATSASAQAKKAKVELEESRKMYQELEARYEREKATSKEARSSLESAQAELTHFRKRAGEHIHACSREPGWL